MNQIEKNSLLIVAGTALFMIMFGIGSIPLLDPDEPVYAETAREMLAAGDFLSPRIFGNFWYDKPPMYYWLVAVAQFIFGDSEFAARFPAALMACGTSVMMYVGITRLFNERAGFWSAMILTSCVEFFYMGKAAVTDTTLLFFMTGALLSFIHKRYWLMYVCMALLLLPKVLSVSYSRERLFFCIWWLWASCVRFYACTLSVVCCCIFSSHHPGITLCIPCMAWNLSIPSWAFTI